jgi:hypothetical protein
MVETETIRIYAGDKERIKDMADARGAKPAEVVADLIREPTYVCPECDEPFDPSEIDPETVREHGVLTSGVDRLVKGERDVKDFECPCCEGRLRPKDIESVDGRHDDRATREDIGVTSENEEQEFSTEEA